MKKRLYFNIYIIYIITVLYTLPCLLSCHTTIYLMMKHTTYNTMFPHTYIKWCVRWVLL